MRAGIFFFIFFALSDVKADDGVYVMPFDPVQQIQIEAALRAVEEFGLNRVIIFPDPRAKSREPLAVRWKLLKVAVGGDPRLVVPSLSELVLLADGRYDRWSRLLDKYRLQSTGQADPFSRYRRLVERGARDILPGLRLIDGEEILLTADRRRKGDPRDILKTRANPNQAERFWEDPAKNEGLLPDAVADIVREERLYGHSGQRGIQGLPDWLVVQLEREQTLNDRLEDTSEFESVHSTDLPRSYFPEQRPTFEVIEISIPKRDVTVLRTGALPGALNVDGDFVPFFIHPHSQDLFKEILGKYKWKRRSLWATPTSSHRSLIVWDPESDDTPFALKTTLDAMIGGSRRVLSRSQIERAAATSALFNTIDKKELLKRGIVFIDEPLGVYVNGTELGYSIRTVVKPAKGAELMPMFSLYSIPAGEVPPIVKMISESGIAPRKFIEDFIMKPLIDQYNYLAWEHGLIGEPHEQNLLIEIKNGRPTGRFFYRDAAGFTINPYIRLRNLKDMSFLPNGIQPESLKSERARPVDNALSYLLHSNFHALKESTWVFPDVTQKWIEETFRKHMSRNIREYTKTRSAGTEERWRKIQDEMIDPENIDRPRLCRSSHRGGG